MPVIVLSRWEESLVAIEMHRDDSPQSGPARRVVAVAGWQESRTGRN